jgi:putative transposase
MDILSLITCFQPLVTSTTMRHFSLILPAILSMTGRVTMRSIARWTEKGGSYRTIQRFFATDLPWNEMFAKFFETHLFNPFHEVILAGDATTITKSGSLTYGIGRFFSGILGHVVKGLEFFVFSLVDVTRRKAYPLAVKQTIRSEAEKEAIKERQKKRAKPTKKRKSKARGRRKGSPNKDKNELNLSGELLRINELLAGLMKLLRVFVKVKYLAMDGHFGHNQAVLMARSNDLDLISKLRKDTPLFEKYEGQYSGKGSPKKYGEQLNYEAMPMKYLKKTEVEGHLIINYYQGIFLHKSFGMPLNVVVIVKTDLKKQKVGYVVLFGSDVELRWEKLIEYYGLRFQIEFNFRDAKQHFGLEDFMNTTEVGVENAVNLSFLMVSLSAKLIKNNEEKYAGINDLKSGYRGVKYAVEAIKIVLEKAETILMKEAIEEVKERMSKIGSIHQPKTASSTS